MDEDYLKLVKPGELTGKEDKKEEEEEPPNKRGKGEKGGKIETKADSKEKKKKIEPRAPIPMGIMLMTPTNLVASEYRDRNPTDLGRVLSGDPFTKMEEALQVSLELAEMEDKQGTKAGRVFGPLRVSMCALRYKTEGDMGWFSSDNAMLIKRATRHTCVPFENPGDNPLWLICCFIADWVVRKGVTNPLQEQGVFPINTPDEKEAHHGPFHAMVFDSRAALINPMKTYEGWWGPVFRWLVFDSDEYREMNLHYEDTGRETHKEWVKKGRPTYPVVAEVIHALAGKPQNISTWFAYRVLVRLLEFMKLASKDPWDARSTFTANQKWMTRVFNSPETMPIGCLRAVPNEAAGSLNFMLALMQHNFDVWMGVPGFGADSTSPPEKSDAEQRMLVLQQFIDEKVSKGDFDHYFDQLTNILFGNLQGSWHIKDGGSIQLQIEKEFWINYCKETLEFHMFTSREMHEAKTIPPREAETGTLSHLGASSAFNRLSLAAQTLVKEDPGLILHAVIMGEDPDRLSPFAMTGNAERYKFLQGRALYWDNYGHRDPFEFFGNKFQPKPDTKLLRRVLGLHPEVKDRQLLALRIGAMKEDKETGVKNEAREIVLENVDFRELISSFAGKHKARGV